MKQLLIASFLLVSAAHLFANDDGGDAAYIPDYRELVRQGYGPREHARDEYFRLDAHLVAAPKPTQAFHAKGYTVYYGYAPVPVRSGEGNSLYAFGYPLDYFRQMLPLSITETNLRHYATVTVENRNSIYGPGEFAAQNRANRDNATTTVQATKATPVNATAPLPAIAEKPAH